MRGGCASKNTQLNERNRQVHANKATNHIQRIHNHKRRNHWQKFIATSAAFFSFFRASSVTSSSRYAYRGLLVLPHLQNTPKALPSTLQTYPPSLNISEQKAPPLSPYRFTPDRAHANGPSFRISQFPYPITCYLSTDGCPWSRPLPSIERKDFL